MTKHDYKQNAYYVIYLIRCVLHNKVPSKEKLDKMDLEQLFEVAKAHSLAAMTAYALESAGIYDPAFEEEKNKAIRKNILFDAQRSKLLGVLEEQKIWYMPLKGAVLKGIYPQIGMRQMADNDILFDMSRRNDVRQIMSDLGFVLKAEREVVDEYLKEPIYNFEMHGELFMEYQVGDMADYYHGIKERILKDDNNNYGYHFSNEEFYLFMLAHEYKHFILDGTGIRSLVDTYVFLNKYSDTLDWTYVNSELDKMGITDYENKNRELSLKVFDGAALSDAEKLLLNSYIISNTYGSLDNKVERGVQNNGGNAFAKFKYAVMRLTVPFSPDNPRYKAFEMSYPFFYKHKVFLPLLLIIRPVYYAVKNRKRAFSELKTLIKL